MVFPVEYKSQNILTSECGVHRASNLHTLFLANTPICCPIESTHVQAYYIECMECTVVYVLQHVHEQ